MCGLAGIISPEKTEFNVNHFNILGTLNDERGGDSCGTFIDGKVEYGTEGKSFFRNFTSYMKYPKSASIALLHCRKTSIGYTTNLAQAQPVIIRNNNKIDFVLMHNGTISNIKVLADKYLPEMNIFNKSDSQILASIIYECGYDVLGEYEGAAVLIMVDYRDKTPKVLIFKGSSCYNDGKNKSERPLYYMVNNDKFYFSSMFESLYCINNKKTIYNFPINQLCRIENNIVYLVKKIDREALEKKPYFTYSNNYSHNVNTNTSYIANNICYSKSRGIYEVNGHPAHGKYLLYPSGYISNTPNTNYPPVTSSFYFFRGRLLYDKTSFDFLTSIDDLFEENVLTILCPEIIDYFSYGLRKIGDDFVSVDENFNYTTQSTGEYVILFTNGSNVVINNKIDTYTYVYPSAAIDIFNKSVKSVYFNFEDLEAKILDIISNKLVNTDAVQ